MASIDNTYNHRPGAHYGVSQLSVNVGLPCVVGTKRKAAKAGMHSRTGWQTAEVVINPRQMHNAWHSLSHRIVRQCYNEITKRLFSGVGIVVFQGNQPRPVSDAFRTLLQKDFMAFARDAMQAIFAFGVVPVAFRPGIGGAGLGVDGMVPYVPAFGSYTITTWSVDGLQQYKFYQGSGGCDVVCGGTTSTGQADPSVVVAHNFGFDPNLDGTLTSNAHCIVEQLAFVDELMKLALTAERIATNPPIFTAYNPHIDDRAEARHKENFFAGDASACADRAEAVYQRDAEQQAAFRANAKIWERVNGISRLEAFGTECLPLRGENEPTGALVPAWGRDWRGAEMPWAREYNLGVTRQLVQQQLPRPRTDLGDLTSQAMDIVCGVMNVPRGLLASDTHVRAGVEAVSEAMHRTVNRWADVLSHLLTAVYNHTYGRQDLHDELLVRMHARRRLSPTTQRADQLITERDLFEVEAKTRVRLAFDLPPSTTPERLDAMYNRGILSWQTYATSQLRLNNFARDELAAAVDPLSKAEQRELLLGRPPLEPSVSTSSSSATTSSSGSESRPKKTKTKKKRAKKE